MVSHTRGRRRRGGVELTPFLKTGRSHCLAICEAPARERVEGGGIPPSPVILGTRAAQGSSLSCTGKHACASACSNMPRCSRARMPKPFETPQDTCGYLKRAKRALDDSANRASSSTHSAIRTCYVNMQCEACTHNLGSLCRQGSQYPSLLYGAHSTY